jgi:hypothetical protein
VGNLAADMHLAIREPNVEADSIADTLFNRSSGLAEIVIPPRSDLIGKTVFPVWPHAMVIWSFSLQRGGFDVVPNITQLHIGDHLLL